MSSAPQRPVLLWTAVSLLWLGGCAAWPRSYGSRPCCTDRRITVHRQPVGWHLFDVTVTQQIAQTFHLMRVGRRLLGLPVRSLNLDDDHVGDTTFFTDRDPETLSPEAVRWGPTRPDDVAQPPLTVTKPKTEGKTPGFFVTDARGVRYLLKLDPADAPELLSGAEVVTSKLLHALGYHVPSYEIAYLSLDDLRMAPDVMVPDAAGRPQPFTDAQLHTLLQDRLRDGTLRVAVSKILDGEVLGPARFKRFRDCTDVRALKLAYAWVNNIDSKDHNSLLVWDGAKTVGYLFDFGTSLGADAGSGGPKNPCAGWTYMVDLKEAALETATLGLHRAACDAQAKPVDRSVGLFSPRLDPVKWKPYAPNLAFEEIDEQDARWIANRMNRLSRAQIDAAVLAGQYSNPADAAYVVDTLEQRRQVIVDRYLEEESR